MRKDIREEGGGKMTRYEVTYENKSGHRLHQFVTAESESQARQKAKASLSGDKKIVAIVKK